MRDLTSLQVMGGRYFRENLFKPRPPVINYGRNHLQLGRKLDGSVYAIDITESSRILVLGLTRSGKTFLGRSLIDRLKQIGQDVLFINDTKNELYSSNFPVQAKFRSGLLPGEKPTALKVVVLRPTFFKQIAKRLQDKNFWYSIDSRRMTRADFMTLMNSDELTPNQRTALELIYQELAKRFKKDKNQKITLELIYEILDSIEGMNSNQLQQMRFKFEPLRFSHFFIEKYERSLTSLLQKGYVLSLNMEGFDNFGKGNFLFPEVTLNIAARECINARRAKKIKPLWIFFDEASRFIGNSRDTSIKQTIINSHDLDARYGIQHVTMWQSLSDVPERILTQSRYIMIPSTADTKTIKDALIDTGMTRNVQRARNKSIQIKSQLKRVRYSWMIFDRMEGTMDLVQPLPPLSMHQETTK